MKQDKFFKKGRKLISRAKEVSKEKGTHYVIFSVIKIIYTWLISPLEYYYYRVFKSSRTFIFQEDIYNYFIHKYNATWRNERAIEVPIIWKIINEYKGKNILEVGNVLAHYFPVNYDIVDKYEKAEGVIKQDVVDFQKGKKYDLIVSISTLEHVGWDEDQYEPMKILRALKNLKNLLTAQGKIVVTLPLGYNPELDKLLNENKLQFTKIYYMKRISKDNKWIEVTKWEDVKNAKYYYPFERSANALVIGIIERK